MVHFLFRRRTFLFTAAPLIMLLAGRPSPSTFWPGLALVSLGEAVRIWAAGYLCKYSKLITAGPFALCRNPLYIGSFLICLGYLLMCNRPWMPICGVAIFWLFHGGAVLHEEKLLAQRFGREYRDYCSDVPRFIPRMRIASSISRGGRISERQGRFSASTLVANNEFQGAACTMLLTMLFALLAYWPSFAPLEQLQASLRP